MIGNVNHGVRQWPQTESFKTSNRVNRPEKTFSATSQSLFYSQSVNYSSGNYSYSSQVEVRYDSVSIGSNGSNGVTSPLQSFFNNLTDSMGGLVDMGGMIDQGYGSMDSPFAFAGQILNRIKTGLTGDSPQGNAVAVNPPPVPEVPTGEVEGTVPEPPAGLSPSEAVEASGAEAIVPVAQPQKSVEPEVIPAEKTNIGAEVAEAPVATAAGDGKPRRLQMIEQRVELGYQKTMVELQARENPVVPENSLRKQHDEAFLPVNKARSLLRHGLKSLRQNVDAPSPMGFSNGFVAGEGETKTMSLQVFTRDGDLVNIEIGSARSAFMGGGETGDGSSINMFLGAMAGGMNFSIEGDLDDGELNAIAELMENINDLAQAFFDSDLQAAFGMAMELGFDQDELTGFALDLNHQKTSFAALQEQGDGGNVFALPESGGQPVFDTLNGFTDMARNVMNHAILDLFEQPTSFVTNMFDALTVGNLFESDGTTENDENQQPGAMDTRWVHDLLSQMALVQNGESKDADEPEEMPEPDGAPVINQVV
jgi:hypothetical protein